MSYQVKYAFGLDDEKAEKQILSAETDIVGKDDIVMKTYVCFASFITSRVKLVTPNSSVFYRFRANKKMLSSLLKWIKKVSSGINIELINTKYVFSIYTYDYTVGENFQRIQRMKDFRFDSNNKAFLNSRKKEARGLKGLAIHDCTVKITINTNNDQNGLHTKILMEYLVMAIIRLLDPRETELFCRIPDNRMAVIDRLLMASNGTGTGHALYCNTNFDNTIKSNELALVLNFNSMYENYSKKREERELGNYRQTRIIDLVLNRESFGRWI